MNLEKATEHIKNDKLNIELLKKISFLRKNRFQFFFRTKKITNTLEIPSKKLELKSDPSLYLHELSIKFDEIKKWLPRSSVYRDWSVSSESSYEDSGDTESKSTHSSSISSSDEDSEDVKKIESLSSKSSQSSSISSSSSSTSSSSSSDEDSEEDSEAPELDNHLLGL
jgi:hypothetical protein